MNRTTLVIAALSIVPALVSCQTSRDCEKARIKAHRAYQELSEVATQRKLAGVDVDGWSKVENKADLLRSAFATEQVTWRSAEKARTDVRSTLESISTDNDVNLEIFKRSAEEAFKLQDILASTCR